MTTPLNREQLEAVRPKDGNELRYRDRMLELLESNAPTSRGQFAPGHFTASAFVLSPDDQNLLLIFHSKLSLWLQPGGHIDATDTTLLEAAKREVLEEVGVLAELHPEFPGILDLDVHTIAARREEPAHEHFDVRFALQAPNFDFQAGSDALSARWVPLGEVEKAHSDASVTRAADLIRNTLEGKLSH